ncbi:hypothetical protein [Streptomyces sp. ST2-7A]|uniref:hypothetical protein n=1 Tax=Streptomyces sp. ST2-7A TaxID=2907214 RepID=UPI001F3DC795|nr:hypothetical protein [Streptomyces sp. ST2-7A]MCE7080782.1 hypothetical protein [Streptomyces sp. ST2-7A]
MELEQHGERVVGFEVIGRRKPFGAEKPDPEITSRFHDNHGNTLDHVYETEDDTLIIRGGEKGSPAHYRGTFSPDGRTVTGAWTCPGGGGCTSTMTRLDTPVSRRTPRRPPGGPRTGAGAARVDG